MLNRRGFLTALVGAFVADPERALWVPGKKLISIPKPQVQMDPDYAFRLQEGLKALESVLIGRTMDLILHNVLWGNFAVPRESLFDVDEALYGEEQEQLAEVVNAS